MHSEELYSYIASKTKTNDVNKVQLAIESFNTKIVGSVLINEEVKIWGRNIETKPLNIEILKTEFGRKHIISFNTPPFIKKEMRVELDPEVTEKINNYITLTKKEYRYVD